jgi:lipopolysaccharide export system permease protein
MLVAMALPRIETLDRYILRRFAAIYASNLVSFTLIFVLVDAVMHFDEFSRQQNTLLESLVACARYYASVTPLVYCQILGPVVAVSAALFTVTTLQRANEFIPILASGRSLQRALVPVLGASLVICGAIFLVQELWIPQTIAAIRQAVESREGADVYRNVNYADSKNGNVIAFRLYNWYLRRAEGVVILPVSSRRPDRSLIQAESAEWIPPGAIGQSTGHWVLRRGTTQEYDANGRISTRTGEEGPSRLYAQFDERKLETTLIPEDIETKKEDTVYMSLGALRHKARHSPDQAMWTLKFYSRFVYPLTNFILILLGLPVIVHFGNRNIFFGALLAVFISTSYFIANSIFQDLGIKGAIPARLGAGFAPILFTALGASLYRKMES